MTKPEEPLEQQAPKSAGTSPSVQEARRKLLKGGLAAGPVIMTLASRPVLAQTLPGQCQTPSGFLSGNVSQQGKAEICAGRTPGFWKQSQHFSAWPAPYFPTTTNGVDGHQATLFHSQTTGFGGSQFSGKTMLQVLDTGGGSSTALGRHICAALLNARSGMVPPTILSETTCRKIWNDFTNQGYYEPTAGVKWYADDIVAYLKTTMPV